MSEYLSKKKKREGGRKEREREKGRKNERKRKGKKKKKGGKGGKKEGRLAGQFTILYFWLYLNTFT